MSTSLAINLDDLLHCRSVESERVEFKASWDPPTTGPQVLRTICAFANDYHNLNGGYLAIGVDERDGRAALPPAGLSASEVAAAQHWTSTGQLSTFGVPIAEGVLERGSPIRLRDAAGNVLPGQTRCLATWQPDRRFVKWLPARRHRSLWEMPAHPRCRRRPSSGKATLSQRRSGSVSGSKNKTLRSASRPVRCACGFPVPTRRRLRPAAPACWSRAKCSDGRAGASCSTAIASPVCTWTISTAPATTRSPPVRGRCVEVEESANTCAADVRIAGHLSTSPWT